MNKVFKTYKLCEITNILVGGDLPNPYSIEKTEMLTIPVFSNGEKNNGLYGYTDKAKVNDPAVTISARGSKVGFAAIRKQPFFPIVRLLSLIPYKDKLDVDFLFYNLKLNRLTGTGSGQPQITIPDISDRTISVPPLFTQQKIASVLSSLDSKIELNNRINSDLEAMAKTLYDYWFVQFDFPNKNGKPYKSSGGKMVWNEELKREVPEGWDVKRIGDFGEFKNGINYDPSLEGNTDAKIINVRNISSSNLFVSQFELDTIRLQKSNVDNYLVTERDILIARSGIPGATRMMLEFAENTIYCGFIIRFQVNSIIEKNYLFYFLKDMEKNTTSKSGGTIMPNVNQDTMKRMLVIDPNEKVIIKFNEFISPIFSKMNAIIQENQNLIELRDWLLPMLMNGQVKVN